MKLDKNGYQSEKRDSFGTEVKIWLIDGVKTLVGAMIALALIFAASFLTQGCGSGSGSGEPVYNENGVCVENCSPDECPPCRYIDNTGNCVTANCASDGIVYPPGDTCDHDGCYEPQKDHVAPPCKVPTDPKIKEMCMPYWAQISKCFSTWDYDVLCGSPEDGLDGKDCYCYGEKAYDPETKGAKLCNSQDDCREKMVTCEEWPPEVCWGLPCMLVGKWDCPSSTYDDTDLEFYDNGDGYCRIHYPKSDSDFYFKPGDDHVQRPPSGPAEIEYSLSEDGSQLFGGTGGPDPSPYTCTKVVEEE